MVQVNLSGREKEVVRLLLQGKGNKQIAWSLGISVRTVEFHLTNVYAKHQVSSRIELILKLGNSTGNAIIEKPGYSTVDRLGEKADNRDRLNSQTGWAKSFRDTVSIIGKEPGMKKRWAIYFFAGLIFGAGYWHYFSLTAKFFNNISSSENTIGEGLLLILALLTYFGVWLIPATLPAVFEFRHSTSLRLSVMAGVTVWASAVLGYYVNYVAMLAIIGLPHMEYLVLFGQRTATIWQDWANIFPKLILFKFLRWAVVGVIAGGVAGLITSSLYSALSKKNYKSLPA
jgi:DNA-binding CsgD family transcriptional regulator